MAKQTKGWALLEGAAIAVLGVYFGVAAIGGSHFSVLMVWWLGIAAGRFIYRTSPTKDQP